ncbi:MAG: hypothetical protein HY537_17220 [Deltaproteobacteria bacterium]|nr:hypothetical protein [Deltaproteobacteria bacterium]
MSKAKFGQLMFLGFLLVTTSCNSGKGGGATTEGEKRVSNADFEPSTLTPLTAGQKTRVQEFIKTMEEVNSKVAAIGNTKQDKGPLKGMFGADSFLKVCDVTLKPISGSAAHAAGSGDGFMKVQGPQCPISFSYSMKIQGNVRNDEGSLETKAGMNSALQIISKLSVQVYWERNKELTTWFEVVHGTVVIPGEGEVKYTRKFKFNGGIKTDGLALLQFKDFKAEIIERTLAESIEDLQKNPLQSIRLMNGVDVRNPAGIDSYIVYNVQGQLTPWMIAGFVD